MAGLLSGCAVLPDESITPEQAQRMNNLTLVQCAQGEEMAKTGFLSSEFGRRSIDRGGYCMIEVNKRIANGKMSQAELQMNMQTVNNDFYCNTHLFRCRG